MLARTQSHLESAIEEDAAQGWDDSGYWLTWPVAFLGLFWFRRGWTVRWDQALAGVVLLGLLSTLALGTRLGAQATPDENAEASSASTVADRAPADDESWLAWWSDLWWTADQQGRRLFEAGSYDAAARHFEDPYWRAVASYRAGNWDQAIDGFAGVATATGSFNLGNAYARRGEYELAITAYEEALAVRPAWEAATSNRDLVASLIPPEPEDQNEQGQAQPTFKADQIEFDLDDDQGESGEVEMQAFSDEQMADMWLRQLTTSPASFLRTKFAIQAARSEAEAEEERP